MFYVLLLINVNSINEIIYVHIFKIRHKKLYTSSISNFSFYSWKYWGSFIKWPNHGHTANFDLMASKTYEILVNSLCVIRQRTYVNSHTFYNFCIAKSIPKQ